MYSLNACLLITLNSVVVTDLAGKQHYAASLRLVRPEY